MIVRTVRFGIIGLFQIQARYVAEPRLTTAGIDSVENSSNQAKPVRRAAAVIIIQAGHARNHWSVGRNCQIGQTKKKPTSSTNVALVPSASGDGTNRTNQLNR